MSESYKHWRCFRGGSADLRAGVPVDGARGLHPARGDDAGDAAGAALIALHERHRSGLGQHVDISGQASCAQAVLSAYLGPGNQSETVIRREAGGLLGRL